MTNRERRRLTGRDIEVLTALDRTVLSAGQLLKLSATFVRPFHSERMARERLAALVNAGWLQSGRYATIGAGAGQNYYQLSRVGYRILYGERAEAPTKRFFAPISLPRQHHTRCLADFIVHTIVAAHVAGAAFTDFYRENTLKLTVGEECLYPDCAFQLILPDGRAFNYLIEIDNHTEQIRSMKDADSWERKARLYDDLQSSAPNRFRVLVVTTRSGSRLKTILTLAAARSSNPQRSVLIGTPLAMYLTELTPLSAPIFLDHHLRSISLLAGPESWKSSIRHNRGAASEAATPQ